MTAADRPSVTRDGMDPLTRAVSDTLDEYLSRHHGILTSHTNPENFLTWLWENGHEVRPSVTDNARADFNFQFTPTMERLRQEYLSMRAALGYGFADLYAEEWDRALVAHEAAGRAETTAATTEDAAMGVIDDVLYEEGITDERHRLAGLVLARLASRGLLASPYPARTHPTEPTNAQVLAALNAMHPRAAAPSLDYWGSEADEMRAALRAALSSASTTSAASPTWSCCE